MNRAIHIAALMLIAAPAAAQDLSNSTALLTHFATRCAQIAADPTIAVSGIAGASARIAGDRSLITHTEPAGENGQIAFRQMTFADGKSSDCALSVIGFVPGQFDDLGMLIADNGAALFGTEITVFGNHVGGDAVQMIATRGYPPAAALTQVQTRDSLELVLSLHSTPVFDDPTPKIATGADTDPSAPGKQAEVDAPTEQATVAPQPQIIEVIPVPQPAPAPEPVLTPQHLSIGQDMLVGLKACLSASQDPLKLAPALLEAGFAFSYVGGGGELNFKKGEATAQLSAIPRDGICTVLNPSAPYALALEVGSQFAASLSGPPASATTVDGCQAIAFTAPSGPATLTYINPSYNKVCDAPNGAAVRLSLQ